MVTKRSGALVIILVTVYGIRNGVYCISTGKVIYGFLPWKDWTSAIVILVLLIFFVLVNMCFECISKRRLKLHASVRSQEKYIFKAIYGVSADPAEEPFERRTWVDSESNQ